MDKIGQIEGIVYRHNGELQVTSPRRPIDPLDQLPMPAREMLNLKRGDNVHTFTSRGCPYNCSFCSVTRFYGKTYRHRPVHDIIEEVESLELHEVVYAPAIALAYKALKPDSPAQYGSNLLPAKLREHQSMYRIAWHGTVMLVFLFLWKE